MRHDVIHLIREEPAAHGVFEQPKTTERMVYCAVRSAGMREVYEAMAHNLKPEVVFVLADAAEYDGEKTCRWGGFVYNIIRVYQKGQQIELTVERSMTK